MRVHIRLATLLKESHVGDESARIGRAINEARRAFEIADTHGIQDEMPAIAVTLGNALSEYADTSLHQLQEAKDVLEKGLAALRSEPGDDSEFMEATLLNSLGKVFSMLGDLENGQEYFLAANDCVERALVLREQQKDAGRELLTLTNLIGVRLKLSGPFVST